MSEGIGKYYTQDAFRRLWPGGPYSFDTDEAGIIRISYPQSNYRSPGSQQQYHPTIIAGRALGDFNRYYDSGDTEVRARFLKYADWLVESLHERDGYAAWDLPFDWVSPGYLCRAPWICSLTYGYAQSALIRAAEVSGKGVYMEAAERSLTAFHVPIDRGGLLRTTEDGDTWYEGIPSPIGAQIFNEVLFCLIGLYEMHVHGGNAEAGELFERGIATVRRRVRDFDLNLGFFKWSRYDDKLLFYAGEKYHDVQTEQLGWLAEQLDDELFARYHERWRDCQRRYADGRFSRKWLFKIFWSKVYGRYLRFYVKHVQK